MFNLSSIKIYKDESCEMMKVTLNDVVFMEGNFWDFDESFWRDLISELANVEELEYKCR